MKAFVSYSVIDSDEIILTLLSSELRKKNFSVTTSQNFFNKTIDYNTMSEINSSHLFIGIITDKGEEHKRVLDEWNYAIQRNVPNLLLIEDTIAVNKQLTGKYIKFNRNKPKMTIDEINKKMNLERGNSDDLLPWILGGTVLLAIIGLLTNKSKA